MNFQMYGEKYKNHGNPYRVPPYTPRTSYARARTVRNQRGLCEGQRLYTRVVNYA